MRRQPISIADSGQTAELIAQHAALLPLWLNYVDGRRAEQQKIQLAMRTHTAPAGAVVEAPAPPPVPVAAAPTQETGPADPNPVAWLMEAPAKAPGTPFDPAADDPFAPPASVVVPDATDAAPSAAISAGAGMDDSDDSGASGSMFAPAAASAAIAAGVDEGGESSAGSPDWLRHFDGDFGGDVSQELVAAMEAVDPSALPYDLQQTLEFGQSPEEIAAALVRAERAGQLDPRLDAAIERMSEVDPLFADARRRADSPTSEDDDEPLF